MRSAGQGTAAKVKARPVYWDILETITFVAFAIWSAAGLFFTLGHITPATVAQWPIPAPLVSFVDLCLQNGDPILILLAFANTHLHATRQWTEGVARRWGFIVLAFSFGIETLGARTGIPFGDYHYTTNFGPMLWLVPLTIPLAWHVVVTNALFLVRTVAPHLDRLAEALFVGVICTIYDFILEPFATTVKHYWTWSDPTIPIINYASWFVLSAFLAGVFAPTLSTRHRLDPRPLLIYVFTILIFIAGEMQ